MRFRSDDIVENIKPIGEWFGISGIDAGVGLLFLNLDPLINIAGIAVHLVAVKADRGLHG